MKTKISQENIETNSKKYFFIAIALAILLTSGFIIKFVDFKEDQNPSYPSSETNDPFLFQGKISNVSRTGELNIGKFEKDNYATGEFISNNVAFYVYIDLSLLNTAGIRLSPSKNQEKHFPEKYYKGSHTVTLASQKRFNKLHANVAIYQITSIN